MKRLPDGGQVSRIVSRAYSKVVFVPMSIGKVDCMGYLYILQSEKNGRYYIGSTNNLSRRIAEHSAGKTKSIRALRPLRIVFKQDFATLAEARRAERKLKRLKSKKIIDRIIGDGIIKTLQGL